MHKFLKKVFTFFHLQKGSGLPVTGKETLKASPRLSLTVPSRKRLGSSINGFAKMNKIIEQELHVRLRSRKRIKILKNKTETESNVPFLRKSKKVQK